MEEWLNKHRTSCDFHSLWGTRSERKNEDSHSRGRTVFLQEQVAAQPEFPDDRESLIEEVRGRNHVVRRAEIRRLRKRGQFLISVYTALRSISNLLALKLVRCVFAESGRLRPAGAAS